jgi:hypothetical protein
VTVGPSAVLVELDDPDEGHLAAVAHRPPGDAAAVPTTTAAVPDLVGLALDPAGPATHLRRAVGVATLSALSVPAVDWRPGDPMADVGGAADVVATVGLFGPAFRKFDGAEVRVVERDPPATPPDPPGVDVSLFDPADCDRAFAGADVCFVTGSTLVYGGLERYLDSLAGAGVPTVVLVGATASILPVAAFAAGVDVVAGARVTDPDRVRAAVEAGDCGTDLHGNGLEKVKVSVAREGAGPRTAGRTGRKTDASADAETERESQ